jgi:hypothetical protein
MIKDFCLKIVHHIAVLYTLIILMAAIFKYAAVIDQSGNTRNAILATLLLIAFWSFVGYVCYVGAKLFIAGFFDEDVTEMLVMRAEALSDEQSDPNQASKNMESLQEEKAELERQQREERKIKLDEILSWVNVTFESKLPESHMAVLLENIRTLAEDNEFKHNYNNIQFRMEGVTNTDLHHLGWIIGKRLGKMNVPIAAFLKETFSTMLANVEMTTIAAKLTNSDGRYSLGLIHPDEALVPHVFPTAS